MEFSTKRFSEWQNQWHYPEKMDVFNYISFNIHPEEVLILSSLFFPKLIEVEGCIFLDSKYDYENYLLWKKEFNNDRTAMEKMINHTHIYDIFSNCTDKIEDTIFEQVGQLLQSSWSNFFCKQFPEKTIIVEYSHTESDYGPILYVFQA